MFILSHRLRNLHFAGGFSSTKLHDLFYCSGNFGGLRFHKSFHQYDFDVI